MWPYPAVEETRIYFEETYGLWQKLRCVSLEVSCCYITCDECHHSKSRTNEQILVLWLLLLQCSTHENIFLEASNYHGTFLGDFFVPLIIKDNRAKRTMATNCWSCKGIYWDDYQLNEAGIKIHFPDLLTLCTVSSNWIIRCVFTQPQ